MLFYDEDFRRRWHGEHVAELRSQYGHANPKPEPRVRQRPARLGRRVSRRAPLLHA